LTFDSRVYFYSFTYLQLTPVTIYFVPPNDPRMHCDFFWEKAISSCIVSRTLSRLIACDSFRQKLCSLYRPLRLRFKTFLQRKFTHVDMIKAKGTLHRILRLPNRIEYCHFNSLDYLVYFIFTTVDSQWYCSLWLSLSYKPTLSTFRVGGNRSTRRKPTTFGRALTDSFHMSP
jgi:hypothetical protein